MKHTLGFFPSQSDADAKQMNLIHLVWPLIHASHGLNAGSQCVKPNSVHCAHVCAHFRNFLFSGPIWKIKKRICSSVDGLFCSELKFCKIFVFWPGFEPVKFECFCNAFLDKGHLNAHLNESPGVGKNWWMAPLQGSTCDTLSKMPEAFALHDISSYLVSGAGGALSGAFIFIIYFAHLY